MKEYDLLIIGGGPGGYSLGISAAKRGLKTALFEKEALWALTGIGCMLLSWFLLRWVDGAVKKRAGWSPRIVTVYDEEPVS